MPVTVHRTATCCSVYALAYSSRWAYSMAHAVLTTVNP